MKKILLLAAVALIATTAAFADIARPEKSPNSVEKPKPGVSTTMEIMMDKSAKEAKLLIPKSQIKQLRAELETLDDDNGNTAAATGGFTRLQTIVSDLGLRARELSRTAMTCAKAPIRKSSARE